MTETRLPWRSGFQCEATARRTGTRCRLPASFAYEEKGGRRHKQLYLCATHAGLGRNKDRRVNYGLLALGTGAALGLGALGWQIIKNKKVEKRDVAVTGKEEQKSAWKIRIASSKERKTLMGAHTDKFDVYVVDNPPEDPLWSKAIACGYQGCLFRVPGDMVLKIRKVPGKLQPAKLVAAPLIEELSVARAYVASSLCQNVNRLHGLVYLSHFPSERRWGLVLEEIKGAHTLREHVLRSPPRDQKRETERLIAEIVKVVPCLFDNKVYVDIVGFDNIIVDAHGKPIFVDLESGELEEVVPPATVEDMTADVAQYAEDLIAGTHTI